MQKEVTQFESFIKSALTKKSELELSEAEMNLLRFLRLLVDIEFRVQKNLTLDRDGSRDYDVSTI